MTRDDTTGAREAPGVVAAPSVAPRWRAIVFGLATTAGVLGLRILLAPLEGRVNGPFGASVPTFYLMMLGGLLLGHGWTLRAVDPRGWSAIGLSWRELTPRALGGGTALGALAVGLPSALLLLAGWLRVEASPPGDWGRAALATLVVLLPAALWEELLTRGYLFTLLRDAIGARRAIVVTSVAFGLLHVENSGATPQSVALVMLAGIFLGSILVATGSLWAAWAAHVAWNFVMAGVLHATVSGIGMGAPNYRTVDAGPDWATGGAWGPEAGLVTGVGLLTGIYIMLRRRRRGA